MKIFKEQQRFTQTWLIILLAMSIIVPIGIMIQEYAKENTKMTTNEFVLTLVGILVSVLFIFFFKLTTRIDEKGIHYQFFPFHFSLRRISWSEINSVNVRNYDPIGEYGW
jgi:integral membrane sensor domain MASE1